MKLLTNESQFFHWMERNCAGWGDATVQSMRAYQPTAYPCYAYAVLSSLGDNIEEPRYLYESDCEMMLGEIRKHTFTDRWGSRRVITSSEEDSHG